MKLPVILSTLLFLVILVGCQTLPANAVKPSKVEVTGPIEITSYKIDNRGSNTCSIEGIAIDENNDVLYGLIAKLSETSLGAACDLEGSFRIENIPSGNYTLELSYPGMRTCTVQVNLEPGDHLRIQATLDPEGEVHLEKPIIYIHPEKEMEVEVNLTYDGELTTTYPKYPENGWKVNAQPDGTLTDENGREYYALYWEGKPRKPLEMTEGFVVSKERTTEFLEEKLELLGLNAKEANEFIIFWLPILEKNEYNLISFAGEDYLEQAKLNISPTPDTEIRICMVFQGLDEEIDFPIQDLTPLKKTRNGFTIVEWGGQELPKAHNLDI